MPSTTCPVPNFAPSQAPMASAPTPRPAAPAAIILPPVIAPPPMTRPPADQAAPKGSMLPSAAVPAPPTPNMLMSPAPPMTPLARVGAALIAPPIAPSPRLCIVGPGCMP